MNYMPMSSGTQTNRHKSRVLVLTFDTCSHLRPGVGHVEQIEIDLEPRCDDGTLPAVCAWRDWYRYLTDATQRMLRPIAYDHDTPSRLQRAGFVDVRHEVLRLPVGEWLNGHTAKGRWYRLVLSDALESLSLAPFTRQPYCWPIQDVKRYIREVYTFVNRADIHAYNEM